jgi:phage tail-like protein
MSDPSSVPSTYLRFLPALYGAPQNLNAHPFIGQYLKIFEKLLSGIDDAAFLENKNGGHPAIAPDIAERKGIRELLAEKVAGNLFYPRLSFLFDASNQDFMPPLSGAKDDDKTKLFAALGSYIGIDVAPDAQTPTAEVEAWLSDFLEWLGRTIALRVDKSWTIDKKRNVIAQMLALYRMRGTVQGMQLLLDLWLDLPLDLTGNTKDGSSSRILTVEVTNPTLPPVLINDEDLRLTFRLRDRYRPGMPIVSSIVSNQLIGDSSKDAALEVSAYAPWLFEVDMKVSTDPGIIILEDDDEFAKIFAACRAAKQVIEEARPAATHYAIRIRPAVQLGYDPWFSSNARLANLESEQRKMSDVNNPVKRLFYCDGMLLNAEKLTMEQSYYRTRGAWLNKALYSAGIANGLEVGKKGETVVTVQAGVAFDQSGNLLINPSTQSVQVLPSVANRGTGHVYLSLPNNGDPQDEFVDDTALVTIVSSTQDAPKDGVLIASVHFAADNTILNVIRGLCATSHIPYQQPPAGIQRAEPPQESSIERDGRVQVSAEALLESAGTHSVTVYFDEEAHTKVFLTPPRVYATVAGPIPFALSVHNVGPDCFTLVVAAVNAIDASTEPVVVEWLAVS